MAGETLPVQPLFEENDVCTIHMEAHVPDTIIAELGKLGLIDKNSSGIFLVC